MQALADERQGVDVTHDELVCRAAAWLRGTWRSRVVITELVSGRETLDAIGFTSWVSVVVECKTSRADFFRDQQKPHRRAGHLMGNFRFYLTESGLLSPEEIPERWGLAEIHGGRITKVKQVEHDGNTYWRGERDLLVSALQRLGAASVEGISVKPYTFQTKCKATLGVAI